MATIALVLTAWFAAADASFGWPDAITVAARDAAELPDPQRLRALERLTARAGDRALPVLVPMLTDRDLGIRLFAARRLGRAGVPAATEAATRWISAPNVPLVDRQFGLDVLRDVPNLTESARQAIEQALRDADTAVRISALDALERHDVMPSLAAVLSALDDDNREVRLRAIRLVAGKRDPRIALPLLTHVEDADRQVRVDAIRALGSDPRATSALLRLMGDPMEDVRNAAVDALAALRAEAAVRPLVALARKRPADDAARRAQVALGKIATPAAIAALIALTRTPPVSAETRGALRAAGAAAVAPLVRELTGGTPGSVAIAAAALGDIGDRRATAPLCEALERRAEVAPVALDALSRIGDPAAVPTLARAAESSDVEIRRPAYAALLALRDARAAAVLARGLGDPDAHVRELSARLAAALGAPSSGLALAALLTDGEREVRRAAAAALATVAVPSSALVTAVVAALSRPGAPARDADEWQAIGEALERAAEPGDAGRLALAWKNAREPERPALLRGFAAAQGGRELDDAALGAQLVETLPGGGPPAIAAADALAGMTIPDDARPGFARRFGEASPTVRARLCGAIARLPDAAPWLVALIRARDEASEVRAAAAWAARGIDDGDVRDALDAAAHDDAAPVAANARAAIAAARGRRSGADAWVGARRRSRDGTPVAGRWVAISFPGAGDVWTVTDDAGVVRLSGPSGGAVQLRAAESLLRVE
jgi:HEAT repeat protein